MSLHSPPFYRNDYCFAGVIGNIGLELGLLGPALFAFPGTLLAFNWEKDVRLLSFMSDAEYFKIMKDRGISVKEYFGHDLSCDLDILQTYFQRSAARGHSLPVCLNSSRLFYHFSYGSKVWQFPHMVLLRKFEPAHSRVEILDSDLNSAYSGVIAWSDFMEGRRNHETKNTADWILDVEFSDRVISSMGTPERWRIALKNLIDESQLDAHNHAFREFIAHLEGLNLGRSDSKRLLIDFNPWLIKKDQERSSLVGLLREMQSFLPEQELAPVLRDIKVIVGRWKSLRKKLTIMRDDSLTPSMFITVITRNLADICQSEERVGKWLQMLSRKL